MSSTIQLYDATLRDGMGGGGMSLTAQEKLRVVERLDALGVDMIEAGFPSSNPKEAELFELLAAAPLEHAQIVAFGMTRRRDSAAEEDEGLKVLASRRCSTSRRLCGYRRKRTWQ
jgi:2-isopropylmalate synthase